MLIWDASRAMVFGQGPPLMDHATGTRARPLAASTNLASLWTTLRIWLIAPAAALEVGYPPAPFVGLFVRNMTLSTVLLVLCVIPFWTSFLIRVLPWLPMLGEQGAINIILRALHLIDHSISTLLYTEFSVIITSQGRRYGSPGDRRMPPSLHSDVQLIGG